MIPRTQSHVAKPSEEALVFRVAALFMEGHGAPQIARILKEEWHLYPGQAPVTRETVYPLVSRAVRLQLLRLVPPIAHTLQKQLVSQFAPATETCPVHVVNVQHPSQVDQVALRAAETAAGLIRTRYDATRRPVKLGLGPGRATLDFCRHLAPMLLAELHPPQVELYAITASCPPDRPEVAPVSFFNLFDRAVAVRCFGLFAENVVQVADYAKILLSKGVRETYAHKDSIEIIVTSMGDFDDPHDQLRSFLDDSWKSSWVGNVQYRPFDDEGPVDGSERAVTLFEISDFVRLAAQRDRHVLLIARQCSACGKAYGRALRSILTNPRLKVWSQLFLDVPMARAVT